jgi:hypothetical protein
MYPFNLNLASLNFADLKFASGGQLVLRRIKGLKLLDQRKLVQELSILSHLLRN